MIPPYEAIRNLLGTYTERMDAGDFDGLGKLFADAVLYDDHGREAARGTEAATALWKRMVRLHEGTPKTRHITANPVIEVDGDSAVCRSAFVVFQLLAVRRLEPIAAGRYHDTFVCTEGTWQFASRQFFLDQMGDVSMHMIGA